MILGYTCARSYLFFGVKTGKLGEIDWNEPERVAKFIGELALNDAYRNHSVIKSVHVN